MPDSQLRIIPLGGLGEIGQNMMAIEYGGEIVVIDAGVLFLEEELPGIDFAVPDFTYLRENRSRFRAVLITHGHEDHIGALPYLLAEMNVPVYSSRLTNGLISVKLREHKLLKDANLNVVEPNTRVRVSSQFGAQFFRVCHSIPDAMGIAVSTPAGVVVHTGDFKIDHTPADGKPTDFTTLSQIAKEGVLLLLSDSTYAEVDGYTTSEQVVGEALDRAIGDATGRVMIATFASLISRIQQIINAAVKYDRKVTVVGRSMINNVNMALKMGYLDAPPDTVIPMSKARDLPLENTVIVATGSQGEPTSALVRIANNSHQDIEIVPGDTVVISASPIPGNETVVAKTVDNLLRQGASVLYSRVSLVHVHGHASREELKMMLSIVRPTYFVPVHGEYRHLVQHASIASDMGIPRSRIFVLEDGDVLELDEEGGEVVDQVQTGHVFVDGRRLWKMDSEVISERKRLAAAGMVTVTVTLSARTGLPITTPSITSSGFMDLEDSLILFKNGSKEVSTTLEQIAPKRLSLEEVRASLNSSVKDFLYRETRRRPTVLTIIEQV